MLSLNPLSNLSTLNVDKDRVLEMTLNVIASHEADNLAMIRSLIDQLHQEYGDHIYTGPFRWLGVPYGGTVFRGHFLHISLTDYFLIWHCPVETNGFYPYMDMEYFDEWILKGRVATSPVRGLVLNDEEYAEDTWQEVGTYKRYKDEPKWEGGAILGAPEGTLVLEYGQGNLPSAWGKAIASFTSCGHFSGMGDVLQTALFYLKRNAEISKRNRKAGIVQKNTTPLPNPSIREIYTPSPITRKVV